MKHHDSLSTYPVLFGEALLFDFSNHLSALLLSPESSLPIRGFRLEGEPESPVEEGSARAVGASPFLGGDRDLANGLGECTSDTDLWAGGRRGCGCG